LKSLRESNVRRKTRRKIFLFIVIICLVTVAVLARPWLLKNDEAGKTENTEIAAARNGVAVAEAAQNTSVNPSPAGNVDVNNTSGIAVQELRRARKALSEAEKIRNLEAITEKYASLWAGKRAMLDLGMILSKNDDERLRARNFLSDGLAACSDDNERAEVYKMIEGLNQNLLWTPYKSKDVYRHAIRKGDTLSVIAKRYNSTEAFIKKINGMRSNRIIAGKSLLVPVRDMSIVVSKSNYELIVYYGKYYLKRYPVGLGKEGKTPVGKFVIDVKRIKPTWYPGDGRVVPYGDPEHPLGTRWLGFQKKPTIQGYGIHGTRDVTSIGKQSSNGCVRMSNWDVEELYDILPRGTRVTIKE